MDHRERVLMTIAREEPDRVPLDLWGSAYSLTDEVYFDVKQELNIRSDVQPYRRNRLSNYYDERVLQALDIDFRHVRLTAGRRLGTKLSRDGTFVDAWGVVNRLTNRVVVAVGHPLADADIDALETYPWPDLYDLEDASVFLQRARCFREKTDYAVVARTPTSLGIIEMCGALRGTEQFLVDLVVDKPFAHRLLRKVSEV
ncbi:MAG TPA: uroporphyrinogen decarboxylase, partial [Anaerolineae bacterium]|nr:uroporphyrinogen decarboxylase [Anaerolineae bacterium]